jgi:hypothetical protein
VTAVVSQLKQLCLMLSARDRQVCRFTFLYRFISDMV